MRSGFPTQNGARHFDKRILLWDWPTLIMPSTTFETPKKASEVTRFPAHRNTGSAALIILAFAAIYFIWGSTYLAIRIGLESLPSLLLPGIRHFFFGLVLYLFFLSRNEAHATRTQWRTAAVTGVALLLLGNGGVCLAEGTVPSGVAALPVATISLWLVLFDWLRPGGKRPLSRVFAGIGLGLAGLVLLVGPAHLGGSDRIDPKGLTILVIGSLSWAFGSLYSKHGQLPASPLLGVAMQSLAGGAALLTVGLLTGEFKELHLAAVSLRSGLALAYLIVFGSGLGFTAYLYLLKNVAAARVGTYALVNPVVALFLGWLFAGESISLRTAGAAAIILTAVLLVITAPHPQAEPATTALPEAGEA